MYRSVTALADVPLALCAPSPPDGSRPLVLLWHGLGGEKEDQLEELERLAGHAYVAIGADAVGHGARRSDALDERLAGEPDEQERAFLDVVEQTAAEVPALLDALGDEAWLGRAGVALVGASLGGFVSLAAPADARVMARVCISGSPRFSDGRVGSPEERLDSFWPCATLLLHGDDDDVVPPGPGLAFIEGLRRAYLDEPDRARRIGFPGEGHLFSASGEAAVRRELDAWLRRWLVDEPTGSAAAMRTPRERG